MTFPRPTLRLLLPLLVCLWTGYGAAKGIYQTLYWEAQERPTGPAAVAWRWSSPPARRLRGFLERAAAHVPAGSRVAFSSAGTAENPEFFRYLWASYWLKEYTVIPGFAAEAVSRAEYWISYREPKEHPRLIEIYRDPAGAVARVEPEVEAP